MKYFVEYTLTEAEPNPFKPPYRIRRGGMTVNLGLEMVNPYSDMPFQKLKREVSRRCRRSNHGWFARLLIAWRKIPIPEEDLGQDPRFLRLSRTAEPPLRCFFISGPPMNASA